MDKVDGPDSAGMRGCPSTGEPPAAAADIVDPAPFLRHGAEGEELELLVQGARCAGCLSKIETGLKALPGVT